MGTQYFGTAPGTVTSGQTSTLPDWYTNYAKTVTNLGQSLAENLPNYQGYVDASGNPVPRVAGLSATQQSGIQGINNNVGSYAPGMASANGTVGSGVGAVQGGLSTVNGAGSNFAKAGDAAGQAMGTINTGLGQIGQASGALSNMGGALSAAQGMVNPAMNYNAAGTNGSEFGAGKMAQYMNPYTNGVVNQIATLGNRNLMENVLPQVNSTFTGAGQFGSSRNGEFEARALRDNQQAISNAQATTLSNAAGQALGLANDAAGRDMTAGAQTGALGNMLTGVGQGYGNQAGTQIGQGAATIQGAGQQLGAGSLYNQTGNSQVNQGAVQGQLGSQLGALGQVQAGLAAQQHQMGLQDAQAQLAAGQLEQNTNQAGLDANYQDFLDQRNYPLQALGGLSQVLQGVSSKVNPDTQTIQVNQTAKTDPLQSLSDLVSGFSTAGS